MSSRPFAFRLVSNAASCSPDFPGYPQIWGEVCAGRLQFDPLQVHDGVWLLDEAIMARRKSSGGLRAFSKNHGADPSMDKLWASWVSRCPISLLGDTKTQCQRIARLINLGSSDCLSALLTLAPQSQEDIQKEWSAENVAYLGRPFMDYVISQDLRGTLSALLERGFLPRSASIKDHPLLNVKSAQAASALLHYGIDVSAFPDQSLIDATAIRDLPAKTMGEIVEVLISQSPIKDTAQAKLLRMSKGLSDKTSEQFQMEARSAGWTPSSRPNEFSPVQTWAQSLLGDSNVNLVEGGALAWLRRQPSHGRFSLSQEYSDAKYAWACLFPHRPSDAQRHAEVAQDMVQSDPAWARLHEFKKVLQEKNALSDGCFEKAVVRLMMERVAQNKDEIQDKWMWEDWFSPIGKATWILDAIRVPPKSFMPLDVVLDAGLDAGMVSHSFALTLALAGACNNERIMKRLIDLWDEGVRPLVREGDLGRIIEGLEPLDSKFASTLQAWGLNEFSLISNRHSPSPRL